MVAAYGGDRQRRASHAALRRAARSPSPTATWCGACSRRSCGGSLSARDGTDDDRAPPARGRGRRAAPAGGRGSTSSRLQARPERRRRWTLDTCGYSSKRIGSFVGFVPADHPRAVILVLIDEPTHVLATAASWPRRCSATSRSAVMQAMRVAPERQAPAPAARPAQLARAGKQAKDRSRRNVGRADGDGPSKTPKSSPCRRRRSARTRPRRRAILGLSMREALTRAHAGGWAVARARQRLGSPRSTPIPGAARTGSSPGARARARNGRRAALMRLSELLDGSDAVTVDGSVDVDVRRVIVGFAPGPCPATCSSRFRGHVDRRPASRRGRARARRASRS